MRLFSQRSFPKDLIFFSQVSVTPWISRVSKHEFPRLTKSILYIHGFCAFEQKSFQKRNTYSLLTQLNGLSCFKGMESDPSNCCLLIHWEGAQVGLEEFREVASLPCCLLTEEQMQVWGCRPGGNLMCLLSSKSDVPVLFKKAKAVFPCNEQPFFFLVPWPGIEPQTLAVRAQSPNLWTTREFPRALSSVPENPTFSFFSGIIHDLRFPLVSLSLVYASTTAQLFSPPHSYWSG